MKELKMKRYKSVFDRLNEPVNTFYNGEYHTPPSRTSEFLVEAVYRPDKYVNIVYNHLKSILKIYNKSFKYGELVCEFLTDKFKEFNIIFNYEGSFNSDGRKYAINSMDTGVNSLTITIQCSPIIDQLFLSIDLQKLFLQYFKELIGHELIHRSQSISIKNYTLQKYINKYINIAQGVGYYADKAELMSYAWQIIEELRFQGAYDMDILEYIKDIGKHPGYSCLIYEEVYLKYYRNTMVINRLIKYIYEYLKGNININEIYLK